MPEHKFFRVIDGPVNIRSLPDTSAPRIGGQLQTGQKVEVFIDSRTVNDSFVWWRHQLGWSAVGPEDASLPQFMEEVPPDPILTDPVNVPGRTIMLPTGRTIERTFIFTRHPMKLDDMVWGQHFGNTEFAFNLGSHRDVKRRDDYFYSQGLHGGIDFGNNTPGTPLVAGIEGTIESIDRNGRFYRPGSVRVKTGEFLVIYGHTADIPGALRKDDPVGPETLLGCTEISQNHLHLEIRHKSWILNPLLFMSQTFSQALIDKIGNTSRFYSDPNWTQWQTPFDQPVIRLSDPATVVLIGPRAARG